MNLSASSSLLFPPCSLWQKSIIQLQKWADSTLAERDLERIFGSTLDWASAFRHLHALRSGRIDLLPRIQVLQPDAMPGLNGAYSRETRLIYISAACPAEKLSEVLVEEVGHFLDQELCLTETPGEEGARFAYAVFACKPTRQKGEAKKAEAKEYFRLVEEVVVVDQRPRPAT